MRRICVLSASSKLSLEGLSLERSLTMSLLFMLAGDCHLSTDPWCLALLSSVLILKNYESLPRSMPFLPWIRLTSADCNLASAFCSSEAEQVVASVESLASMSSSCYCLETQLGEDELTATLVSTC